MKSKELHEKLKQEALAFDLQTAERVDNGFIPDLRNLRTVTWFYNNPWREPEFAKIQWFPTIFKLIDKAKETGKKVLEVGCGHGMVSLEMARAGMDVTGLDLSPKSIEVASSFADKSASEDGFGSLKYLCGDFLTTDLPSEFDSIVFFRSLHHFPDARSVCQKAASLLRDGGRILMCEPIRENFSRNSAMVALTLRMLMPTWKSYEEKMGKGWNEGDWESQLDDIFKEYTCVDHHEQSVMDNSTKSENAILSGLTGLFRIEAQFYSDAFIDKLIGGLRGKDRYHLARYLKSLDQYCVDHRILPPTNITLFAIKETVQM